MSRTTPLTTSPPTSPRVPLRAVDGPPPFRQAPPGPLLKGLIDNSADKVSDVLGRNAGAAMDMYLDSGFEPPLCAAARLGCGEDVFQVLLSHGLDVNDADTMGRSPLAILTSVSKAHMFCTRSLVGAELERREARIAVALLRAGADPKAHLSRESMKTCIEGALDVGKHHLHELYVGISRASPL